MNMLILNVFLGFTFLFSGVRSSAKLDFSGLEAILSQIDDSIGKDDAGKALEATIKVFDHKISGYEKFLDSCADLKVAGATSLKTRLAKPDVVHPMPIGAKDYDQDIENIKDLARCMIIGLKDLRKNTKGENRMRFDNHYKKQDAKEKAVLMAKYVESLETMKGELSKLPEMFKDNREVVVDVNGEVVVKKERKKVVLKRGMILTFQEETGDKVTVTDTDDDEQTKIIVEKINWDDAEIFEPLDKMATNVEEFLKLLNPIKELTMHFVRVLNTGFGKYHNDLKKLCKQAKTIKKVKSKQTDSFSELMNFLETHQGQDKDRKEEGSLYQICEKIRDVAVAGVTGDSMTCNIRPFPKKGSRMITKMIQKYDMHSKQITDSFGCEIITTSFKQQIEVLKKLFTTFGNKEQQFDINGEEWSVSIQRVKLNLSKIGGHTKDDVEPLRFGYTDDKIIFHVKNGEKYLRVEAIIMCRDIKALKKESHKFYDVLREAGNLVCQQLNLVMAKHVRTQLEQQLVNDFGIVSQNEKAVEARAAADRRNGHRRIHSAAVGGRASLTHTRNRTQALTIGLSEHEEMLKGLMEINKYRTVTHFEDWLKQQGIDMDNQTKLSKFSQATTCKDLLADIWQHKIMADSVTQTKCAIDQATKLWHDCQFFSNYSSLWHDCQFFSKLSGFFRELDEFPELEDDNSKSMKELAENAWTHPTHSPASSSDMSVASRRGSNSSVVSTGSNSSLAFEEIFRTNIIKEGTGLGARLGAKRENRSE